MKQEDRSLIPKIHAFYKVQQSGHAHNASAGEMEAGRSLRLTGKMPCWPSQISEFQVIVREPVSKYKVKGEVLRRTPKVDH